MVVRLECLGHLAIGKAEAREHGDDMATFALIPAVAAARLPHGLLHFTVNHAGVISFGFSLDLNGLEFFCLSVAMLFMM